jgi:hypothetical protein
MNLENLNTGINEPAAEAVELTAYEKFCQQNSIITNPDTIKNTIQKIADQFEIDKIFQIVTITKKLTS